MLKPEEYEELTLGERSSYVYQQPEHDHSLIIVSGILGVLSLLFRQAGDMSSAMAMLYTLIGIMILHGVILVLDLFKEKKLDAFFRQKIAFKVENETKEVSVNPQELS